jgi:GT2 family glycosyltransferase
MKSQIDLSIIVVAHSLKAFVHVCLSAVRASTDKLRKEIIYVDNASEDGTLAMIADEFPETITVASDVNLGFARANNVGYARASGEFVLLLNADAFVSETALQETVDFMAANLDVAAAGARLIRPDGQLQTSAHRFVTPWKYFLARMNWENEKVAWLRGINQPGWQDSTQLDCDWVPGCYLMARKSMLEQLDFFLHHDLFMYLDDVDICLRLKKLGGRVVRIPVDVVHVGGANVQAMQGAVIEGAQIKALHLESEFIYFRQNFSVVAVLLNYALMLFAALLRISKRVLFFQFDDQLANRWQDIRMGTKALLVTRFGKKPLR